jgi:hypothetical protein
MHQCLEQNKGDNYELNKKDQWLYQWNYREEILFGEKFGKNSASARDVVLIAVIIKRWWDVIFMNVVIIERIILKKRNSRPFHRLRRVKEIGQHPPILRRILPLRHLYYSVTPLS